MSRPGYTKVTLKLDVTAFTDAMRAFGDAVRKIVPFAAQLTAAVTRYDARRQHGPRNFTAGLWQSDLCGAWVHDACPLPGHCDCTCHGGTLR